MRSDRDEMKKKPEEIILQIEIQIVFFLRLSRLIDFKLKNTNAILITGLKCAFTEKCAGFSHNQLNQYTNIRLSSKREWEEENEEEEEKIKLWNENESMFRFLYFYDFNFNLLRVEKLFLLSISSEIRVYVVQLNFVKHEMKVPFGVQIRKRKRKKI